MSNEIKLGQEVTCRLTKLTGIVFGLDTHIAGCKVAVLDCLGQGKQPHESEVQALDVHLLDPISDLRVDEAITRTPKYSTGHTVKLKRNGLTGIILSYFQAFDGTLQYTLYCHDINGEKTCCEEALEYVDKGISEQVSAARVKRNANELEIPAIGRKVTSILTGNSGYVTGIAHYCNSTIHVTFQPSATQNELKNQEILDVELVTLNDEDIDLTSEEKSGCIPGRKATLKTNGSQGERGSNEDDNHWRRHINAVLQQAGRCE